MKYIQLHPCNDFTVGELIRTVSTHYKVDRTTGIKWGSYEFDTFNYMSSKVRIIAEYCKNLLEGLVTSASKFDIAGLTMNFLQY